MKILLYFNDIDLRIVKPEPVRREVVQAKELRDVPVRRVGDCHFVHVNDTHVSELSK